MRSLGYGAPVKPKASWGEEAQRSGRTSGHSGPKEQSEVCADEA